MSRKQYGQMSVETDVLDDFLELREKLHTTNSLLLREMITWASKNLS